MNKYNALLGIGLYEDEQPWLGGSASTSASGTSSGGSVTDKISSWLGLAKEGVGIFQTIKSGSGSDVTYVAQPGQLPAPQNNTMKYALIGGGLALAATAIVLMTRGGKKKLEGVPPKKARKPKK